MDWIPRFGLAVVLLWVSVSNVNVTVLTAVGKVEQPSTLADEAREYLGAALALVEEHSIKRDSVDWEVVTAEAFDIARDAQTPSETHEAVRFVLRSLNDAHSGFFDPEQMANMNRTMATASGEPVGRLLADRVGYVRVPTFGSFDLPVVNDFATRLQQVVREVDQGDPCGWIVDLRDNDGGNMWAMLTGIGPILGEGESGAFVDANGARSVWSYRGGEANIIGGSRVVWSTEPAYQLTRPAPPVAVLINSITASSGEAIAVAFQGRPKTQTFGQPTRGLTTGNQPFFLSDGAMMNLTTVLYTDRLGRRYGGSVEPDHVVSGEQVMLSAQEWLVGRAECR